MRTKLPTPRDRLSRKPITSPLRKKSRTTFRSPIVDLEEDGEQTCSNEIGGGGGEFFCNNYISNIKEKLKPNLDQVIDNIQVELVVSAKLVVSIVEPTQPIVVATKSSQLVQHVIEYV
jgi:hypothetical protein